MKLPISKYGKKSSHAFTGAGDISVIPTKMKEAIRDMMQSDLDHVVGNLEVNAYTNHDWGGDDWRNEHVIISVGTAWGLLGGVSLEKLLLAECATRPELADMLEDLAAKIRNPRKWRSEKIALERSQS